MSAKSRRSLSGIVGIATLDAGNEWVSLQGSGGNRLFKTTYFLNGNITAAMNAGTLKTLASPLAQSVDVRVTLEALSSETPVLGSDRDGMRDLLPAERRFKPGDVGALGAALARFLSEGCPEPSANLVDRVRSMMSLATFRQSFSSTLLGLVPGLN